jgi:TrmH family RNA methyltransferase
LEPISSLQNPFVKQTVALRDRRDRQAQGQTIVDGTREITRALAADVEFVRLFVCESLCGEAELELLHSFAKQSAKQIHVTERVFEKLAFGERRCGLLAVVRTPKCSLADIQLPAKPLVVVLEGLEKPGNLGAILRSADGAGVHAVVVAADSAELYNPNAIRASLGTIFSMPLCAATPAEVLAWLRAQKLTIFAAQVESAKLYTAADFRAGTAIVLGSEADGLSRLWSASDVQAIRLPMQGVSDSLNVSVAAGILCYEALRQRSEPS